MIKYLDLSLSHARATGVPYHNAVWSFLTDHDLPWTINNYREQFSSLGSFMLERILSTLDCTLLGGYHT